VILTGMSGGARMSSLFASAHPELVQAVGAVAGLRSPGVPVCRPVPILSFHGTNDRLNPYGGSGTPRWNESVPDAARAWALANGITAPPAEVAVSRTLTRTTYGAQGQPGEVTLWTSRGAGHTWPGGHLGLLLSLFLGRTSREIDATKSIWEFGLRHADDP
jgi:polyhydroxybutyrate depolymerase